MNRAAAAVMTTITTIITTATIMGTITAMQSFRWRKR
jgi:hypothetical protein